jgi:hypothetical protein
MKSLVIKRHPSLVPLSRDNGVGLLCAQRLRKAVRASANDRLQLAEQMRVVFTDLIGTFLNDEHRVLSPVIANNELRDRLEQHHDSVRSLLAELEQLESAQDPGLGLLSRIADVLDNYVRWEENTLFPCIQEQLDGSQLEKLSETTAAIEASRTRPTQQLHSSVSLDKQSGVAETCVCSKAKSA